MPLPSLQIAPGPLAPEESREILLTLVATRPGRING